MSDHILQRALCQECPDHFKLFESKLANLICRLDLNLITVLVDDDRMDSLYYDMKVLANHLEAYFQAVLRLAGSTSGSGQEFREPVSTKLSEVLDEFIVAEYHLAVVVARSSKEYKCKLAEVNRCIASYQQSPNNSCAEDSSIEQQVKGVCDHLTALSINQAPAHIDAFDNDALVLQHEVERFIMLLDDTGDLVRDNSIAARLQNLVAACDQDSLTPRLEGLSITPSTD
ncbi:hypothetical protein BT63DRAFT_472162 [Microthyrium microscopicum]|uniref:Uncharacterized protein n=1 Tax=Microthyrium microscopicum TaxID=703497 RepID=A0A6A6U7J4_9PEZI|nr:hypothetical protein BT63DRAFT_472162 [Microthyrium microscopicum]